MSKVLVLYYSSYGHIEKMAEAEETLAAAQKKLTFAYDQPKSTGYGSPAIPSTRS